MQVRVSISKSFYITVFAINFVDLNNNASFLSYRVIARFAYLECLFRTVRSSH